MATAYGTIDAAVEAMKLGAADHILKPFSLEALESTVRKVLAAGRSRRKSRAIDRNPLSEEFGNMVTRNPQMRGLLSVAQRVANSAATVFIQGESGTGKR